MVIKGFASSVNTVKYFQNRGIYEKSLRYTGDFYSLPIGMGTHLGDFSDRHSQLYIEALTNGLENGINFIDTAINYRGMRSERDIGKVLHNLINIKGNIKREEIIISTKGGQIYGDILCGLKPMDYLEKVLIPNGILEREDVNIIDNHRHTLNPKFYKISIELSMQNLGIETIDIHYIHNPEISLNVLGADMFYKRLKSLFEFYEEQVEMGNIRFYGMATWDAFIDDIQSRWYISLAKVVEIAKTVAGDKHHFKFIQLPYNKVNNLAAVKQNQELNGSYYTPIQVANELGLNVTVSAPLNQTENLNQNELSPKEMIKYVASTKGVYAMMIGMKTKKHIMENMKFIL